MKAFEEFRFKIKHSSVSCRTEIIPVKDWKIGDHIFLYSIRDKFDNDDWKLGEFIIKDIEYDPCDTKTLGIMRDYIDSPFKNCGNRTLKDDISMRYHKISKDGNYTYYDYSSPEPGTSLMSTSEILTFEECREIIRNIELDNR